MMIAGIVSAAFVVVVLVFAFSLCKAASEWSEDYDELDGRE